MAKITLFETAADCSGCGACLTVCPRQAITMEKDSLGCFYPKIREDRCIGCGKCTNICGYRMSADGQLPRAAYAGAGRQDDLVSGSASGGIFASLAKSCIEEGGLAAGAVMDLGSSLQVYHVLSGSMADVRRMQGSKYVQSEALRCYDEVIKAVGEGKTVLFSGTPCQVSAIKRLTGDPDNLVTVDIVCHGVPPVQLLEDYRRLLGKRLGGEITGLKFRSKGTGSPYCAGIRVKRGTRERRYFLKSGCLSFYKYFLEGVIFRENCYTCPYAGRKRISDITIGDYWGVEKHHEEDIAAGRMPQRGDWSCVLVNTEKGAVFLKRHEAALQLFPAQAERIAESNRQLNAPVPRPENRDTVQTCYERGGYAAVEASFIRSSGGYLCYFRKVIRNIRQTKNLTKTQGTAHED